MFRVCRWKYFRKKMPRLIKRCKTEFGLCWGKILFSLRLLHAYLLLPRHRKTERHADSFQIPRFFFTKLKLKPTPSPPQNRTPHAFLPKFTLRGGCEISGGYSFALLRHIPQKLRFLPQNRFHISPPLIIHFEAGFLRGVTKRSEGMPPRKSRTHPEATPDGTTGF